MSSELSKGNQSDRVHSTGSGGSRVAGGGGRINSVDKSTSASSTPNFLSDSQSQSADRSSRISYASTVGRSTTASRLASTDFASRSKDLKVVALGEANVGKTSIVQRFVTGNYSPPSATIGASFVTKLVEVETDMPDDLYVVKLNLWDTAGQEKYRALATLYYRGCECALMVYDITDRNSFEQIRDYWINRVVTQCDLPFKEDLMIALVGNKVDLDSERVVSTQEGSDLAALHKAIFFEVSAKEGDNIDKVFQELVLSIPIEKFVCSHDTSLFPTNPSLKLETRQARRAPGCCAAPSDRGRSRGGNRLSSSSSSYGTSTSNSRASSHVSAASTIDFDRSSSTASSR